MNKHIIPFNKPKPLDYELNKAREDLLISIGLKGDALKEQIDQRIDQLIKDKLYNKDIMEKIDLFNKESDRLNSFFKMLDKALAPANETDPVKKLFNNIKKKSPVTPEAVKQFFDGYIFPCMGNKKPAVDKGTSWKNWTGDISLIKSLAGLNCDKADIVVFDFDLYKKEFKDSPQSKALYEKVKSLTKFKQTTQSGGEHYFFKQPAEPKQKNAAPLPGIEIRGVGGYVILYSFPFKNKDIKSFEDFKKSLPVCPTDLLKGIKQSKTKREFGPGQNNRAIPQRAGKAGWNNDIELAVNDIIDLAQKNPKNPELGKHAKDYFERFAKSQQYKADLNNPILDLKNRLDALGCQVRLNIRRDRIEIKGFKEKESWSEISTEDYSELFLKAKMLGPLNKLSKGTFDDAYKALANQNQVDPFIDYLKSLKRDKKERLKNFLSKVFKIDKEHKLIAEWALKSILLAGVLRAFKPGAKHDYFVIFSGPQGIGKSSLLYELFADKSYYSNTVSFFDSSQKLTEKILGKVLIEFSEMSGIKKADIEKIKNIVSGQQDRERLAYRKDAKDYKRTCVFVGTGNDYYCLPDDPTGNRRFVLLPLKKKLGFEDLKKKVKENRDQLWAEAYQCFKNNESPALPEKLWELSKTLAEKHRSGDYLFEESFLIRVANKKSGGINIPDILKEMLKAKEITQSQTSPLYQSKAAQLLIKEGYNKDRMQKDGLKKRLWIKI